MCYYITATLPAHAGVEAVRGSFRAHKRALVPVSNDIVVGQLPKGAQYFETTRGMCDCGTALGARRRGAESSRAADRGRIRKLRRSGWSQEKIARWQAEKSQAAERQAEARPAREATYAPDAQEWAELLRDVLASGHASRVGILLHWYRSSPAQERITLSRVERVRAGSISPDLLLEMD